MAPKAPRILVVDDNPATLYSTSRVLRSAGWETVEAPTGFDAIEKAKNSVDLVVLDVNLPDINGFEVCRKIRQLEGGDRIPIIHLSATFVGDRDKVQGFEGGADGYLTHPIEPPVLIATVKAFLRTHDAEQDRQRLLVSERAAREEAERANRFKDEFLAVLSHELRTPLHAISGWAEILKMAPADVDTTQEAAEAIGRNAAALGKMIADLLDISRITTGQLRLELQSVDFAETLRSAMTSLEPQAAAKKIALVCETDPDLPPVQGDPERLRQVIWNLVSNAIKFTPEGGAILVGLMRTPDGMEFSVKDNGAGIAPDLLEVIFDRFRQGDSASTRKHGGLGLGLALARQFIELHGGKIHALSAGANRGSTFVVWLPSANPQNAQLPHGAPPDSSPIPLPSEKTRRSSARLNGARVLIVDDDSDARELMRRILEPLGAKVLLAASAAEAMAAIDQFSPNILVSDIGMPFEDGYQFIRQVRQRGYTSAKLPAVALTAFASAQDKQLALTADFQRHLAKPMAAEDLVLAVGALLAIQNEKSKA